MSEDPKRPRPGPKTTKKKKAPGVSIPNWLFYVVVLLVLGLWAAGLVLTFIEPSSFQMPASLNGAVPVVLVGLFGTKAASDHRGGDDNDE